MKAPLLLPVILSAAKNLILIVRIDFDSYQNIVDEIIQKTNSKFKKTAAVAAK